MIFVHAPFGTGNTLYRLWHATKWPGAASVMAGQLSAHLAVALEQRVRKGQPDGACRGLGISPVRAMRWLARAVLGSGTGTALIKW